jgi:hypothetical protein
MYSDEIATSVAVTTAYVAMTGSPYNPLITGTLRKLRLLIAGAAATSLIESVTVRLTNPKWGVPIILSIAGNGLRTVPATPQVPVEFNGVDAPVQIGSPITIEVKGNVAATTPFVQVIGFFS